MPARAAVIDDRGKIVVVNQAWINYCKENGLSIKKYDVGSDYLQLCSKAQGFCRESGPKVAAGIESVISAAKIHFTCNTLVQHRTGSDGSKCGFFGSITMGKVVS